MTHPVDLTKSTPLRKLWALLSSAKFQGHQNYYSFKPLVWNYSKSTYGFDMLRHRITWLRPAVWQFAREDGSLALDYRQLIPEKLLQKPLP